MALFKDLYGGGRIPDSYLKYVTRKSEVNLMIINWKGDLIEWDDAKNKWNINYCNGHFTEEISMCAHE